MRKPENEQSKQSDRRQTAESLLLFKELVENSYDAVGMSTPEGKHYYQNKAFDELFGSVGENPPESLYADPSVGHEVFRTIMAGAVWTGEVQMYARDRRVLTILLRAFASKDEAGRIKVLVGVYTDITGRKQAETELRKTQLITDNIPVGLYLYHLEDISDDRTLRMVYANPAVKTLTGLGPEDVVDKTLDENFPGLRAQGIPQRYAEVMRTQTPITFDDIVYGDDRVVLASFSVNAFPLPGNMVGIAFENITARKLFEKAIETSNHRLTILNALLKESIQESDLKTILRRALELILSTSTICLQAKGRIFIADGNGNYALQAYQGFDETESAKTVCSEFSFGRAAKLQQVVFVDTCRDCCSNVGREHGHYCIPLVLHAETVGMLCLCTNPGHECVDDEVGFLESVANALSSILARKETETALMENEKRFRTLADYTYNWELWLLPDESLAYCSPSAKRITGYDAAEFIADPRLRERIVHPADKKAFNIFIRTQAPMGVSELRFRIMAKSGGIRWIGSVRHAMHTGDGTFLGFRISNRDITDLVEAEEEKAESQDRFRQLAENIHEIFFLIDAATNMFLYVSPAVKSIIGFSPKTDSEKASTLWGIVLAEDRQRLGMDENWVFSDTGHDEDFRIARADGKTRWLRLRTFPIFDEQHRVARVAGIAADITDHKLAAEMERQHLQQLQQADKMISLGTLVAGVAHEINNPNNFITLNTPLLRDAWQGALPILEEHFRSAGEFDLGGIPYSEMRETIFLLFSGIEDGAQRIQSIVENLKNYARKDVCGYEEEVDVKRVVRDAVSLMRNTIEKSTNAFSLMLPNHSCYIKGNKQKLAQVVVNLIQNSCEALESRDHAITVAVEKSEHSYTITVTDEGCGIPEENLSRVLEPFFTSRRGGGGTGLGLSVSNSIVRDHNGRLEFESSVVTGTTARVVLPCTTEKETQR